MASRRGRTDGERDSISKSLAVIFLGVVTVCYFPLQKAQKPPHAKQWVFSVWSWKSPPFFQITIKKTKSERTGKKEKKKRKPWAWFFFPPCPPAMEPAMAPFLQKKVFCFLLTSQLLQQRPSETRDSRELQRCSLQCAFLSTRRQWILHTRAWSLPHEVKN